MDDPLSRGLPFELADIWRRSALQVKDEDQSLFAPLEASFPPLNLNIKGHDFDEELIIPPFDDTDGVQISRDLEPPDIDLASPLSELWDTGQGLPENPGSVWDLDLDLDRPLAGPRLHTWETFEKKTVPNAERTTYLSEAGFRAFDAALAEHGGKSNGVLPHNGMLRALCNLALGRASVFFQWDEDKAAFVRTLKDVPISGYSYATCDSFITHVMDYASRYRSIRSSSIGMRPKRAAQPCRIAFNGCVGSVLDAIEERITSWIPQVRSVLQLQALVNRPHELLGMLDQVRHSIDSATSDESIISALSDHIYELASANSSLSGILRTILERTSTPWLETLAIEVGLIDDPAVMITEPPDEGAHASASGPESSTATVPRLSGELPGFMSDEDRSLIHDTTTSSKLLRKTLPHPTADGEARRQFHLALSRDEGRFLHSGIDRQPSPSSQRAFGNRDSLLEEELFAWASADVQHDLLTHTNLQMSNLPRNPLSSKDILHTAVISYCSSSHQPVDQPIILNLDISPLDRLRPALTAQNHHLNRTILRQLFASGLAHHLNLQKSYHFLSSGELTTRLSTALFSQETQSAERKRGTIPTGETMGLRLGAARSEQRWPPASSELRLTLMDVLTVTYQADYPSLAQRRNSKELPGGLSFSIRELPEQEIERVLDPNSIYALDFLRLQYTAPAPLDAILTPATMQTYDAVFRQLLRLLRALHVTTSLTRAASNRQQQTQNAGDQTWRFAQSAHAFISTLLSHMMDMGIAAPWRAFTRRLDAISKGLGDDITAMNVGIESLKSMHTACLDTIRSRLFLRRKQEKLRLAVEEVLSAVLKGAGTLERGDDGAQKVAVEDAERELDEKVKTLLSLLRDAVDKPPKMKATNVNDGDEDDVEMMRILLMRLDWNGFYGSGEATSTTAPMDLV